MTPISRVSRAIEDFKLGKMVVMVDDEDRENEGDLVYPAIFSTPQKVNFMATHAKGLICMPISSEIATRLNLHPMVSDNTGQHETAFTVSVDDVNCTTGISAGERDMTIKRITNTNTNANDLVRPGHIFPLIAKDGGTLVRTGHTEGSVDLCKLAGLSEAAVICEIIKEDGEMARRPDLDIYCKEHDLNMVYISDIVEYRLKYEKMLKALSEKKTMLLGNSTVLHCIKDHEDNVHEVHVFGNIGSTCNVKFHNIISSSALLHNEKNFNSLVNSIEYLGKHGGILVLLRNKHAKIKNKEYGVGAQILAHLGVKKITLLSSELGNEFKAIGGFGLEIVDEKKI